MVTQYVRPALLIIAGAIAVTTAQSYWNYDRTRAILLGICGLVCLAVALLRIKMVRR
jgi:drug/metabolite transporter (DMT)-like permease